MNKIIYCIVLSSLLLIGGCNVKGTPLDEETGLYINDQGQACYYKIELNIYARSIDNEANIKLLQWYGYPENYQVESEVNDRNEVKLVILDQYSCVIYLDVIGLHEFGRRLGLINKGSEIKE